MKNVSFIIPNRSRVLNYYTLYIRNFPLISSFIFSILLSHIHILFFIVKIYLCVHYSSNKLKKVRGKKKRYDREHHNQAQHKALFCNTFIEINVYVMYTCSMTISQIQWQCQRQQSLVIHLRVFFFSLLRVVSS